MQFQPRAPRPPRPSPQGERALSNRFLGSLDGDWIIRLPNGAPSPWGEGWGEGKGRVQRHRSGGLRSFCLWRGLLTLFNSAFISRKKETVQRAANAVRYDQAKIG